MFHVEHPWFAADEIGARMSHVEHAFGYDRRSAV